jgi:hypothetical protein
MYIVAMRANTLVAADFQGISAMADRFLISKMHVTPVGLHVQGKDRFMNELGYNEALTSERVNMLLINSRLTQR